jgi:hypothetical protein
MAALANSLKRLFQDFDRTWPHRDHSLDGWYHPPQPGYPGGHVPGHRGLSHAIDVGVRGISPPYVINAILRRSDVMYYIIWDVRVWSTSTGWDGHPYHVPPGGSDHRDHMHIEIRQTDFAEEYGGSWGLLAGGVVGGAGGGGSPSGGTGGIDTADPRDTREPILSIGNRSNQVTQVLAGARDFMIDTMRL